MEEEGQLIFKSLPHLNNSEIKKIAEDFLDQNWKKGIPVDIE
jgi:hypothetical protein